jgi:ATP-binding cassette, subfamily B, bacterial PglK
MSVRSYLRAVLQLLSERGRRRLPWLFLAFLLAAGLDLIGLSLIGPFVASVRDARYLTGSELGLGLSELLPTVSPQTLLYLAGAALVLAFALKSIATYFVNRTIVRFAFTEQAALRERLLRNYLALSLEDYVNTRTSADLFASVLQRTNVFTNQALLPLFKASAAAVILLVLIAFLLWFNWAASIMIGASVAALAVLYDRLLRRHLRKAGQEVNERTRGLITQVEHVSHGFKEIRTLGCETFFAELFGAHARAFSRASALQQSVSVLPRLVLETLLVTIIIITLLATMFAAAGDAGAHLAALGIFSFAGLRAVQSTSTILDASNQIRFGLPAVTDLRNQLLEIALGINAPGDVSTPRIAQPELVELTSCLTASSVTYRYPHSPSNAIEEVDLDIPRGTAVGIVGPSGCGKTTLVDVLLGLLTPTEGKVLVDGKDIRGYERAWRQHVAYIPQNVFLIEASIRDNIALGESPDQVDSGRIAVAVAGAQLGDFVAGLPEGILTTVGQRGMRLSGGQRQRIALARALYFGKDVIVMDEATAALDEDTEAAVMDAIHALRGGKTLVIIAHRTSTLEQCDRIFRLELGRVVHSGTFAEVIGHIAPDKRVCLFSTESDAENVSFLRAQS